MQAQKQERRNEEVVTGENKSEQRNRKRIAPPETNCQNTFRVLLKVADSGSSPCKPKCNASSLKVSCKMVLRSSHKELEYVELIHVIGRVDRGEVLTRKSDQRSCGLFFQVSQSSAEVEIAETHLSRFKQITGTSVAT